MHPAFSVLFFTVTSGIGFGLLFCLLIAVHAGVYPHSILSASGGLQEFLLQPLLIDIAIATALFTIGLISSTFHLANIKNAWRSFTRFRSSWLSREAVFAVLMYPLIGIYALALWTENSLLSGIIALIMLTGLVVLVYCTAMIYASLKTIPQWHNRFVSPSFLVFSLISGLLAYNAISPQGSLSLYLVLPVLLLGLVLKLLYFRSLGEPEISNINTATGFASASQASITLFDTGHSSKNFSQREFIYTVGPKTTALARKVSVLAAFLMPVALLVLGGAAVAWLALISHYLGMLLERWLFFVEAKHVVRHYYQQ